jgi:hypothetical protein
MILDTVTPSSALLAMHLQTIQLLRDVSHVRNYSWNEGYAQFSEAAFELQRTRPGNCVVSSTRGSRACKRLRIGSR